jgi:hypothetical protein
MHTTWIEASNMACRTVTSGEELQKTADDNARVALFEKARKFLVVIPPAHRGPRHTPRTRINENIDDMVNEANLDAVRAEVERSEALPLVLTIQDHSGSNEEATATVARWDRIVASLWAGASLGCSSVVAT